MRAMINQEEAARVANQLAAEGWNFLQTGNAHEAEQRFRQSLARDPQSAHALHGLAIIGHQTGNYLPALVLFDKALAVDPTNAAIHANRGNSLAALQRTAEAIAAFARALELSPGLASASVNLATALHSIGRLDEAAATMERVCLLQPTADALNNLGNLYKDQGRLDESLDCYERALHLNPMLQQAFSNKLAAYKVDTRLTPIQILAKHREWSCWFEAVSTHAPLLRNSPDPERRIRIGYVSPDCHTALPAFLDHVIAAHDRTLFDVYCYFNNPQSPQKLQALGVMDRHRIMRGVPDQAIADKVAADGIDILVDIAGHTGNNRLGVFARRVAPVQITWLDYLCTTGLDAMDYRITDAIADPPGSEEFHSEQLLRLPDTQWCWQPDDTSPPVAALPALQNGFITFGSFNHAQKLTQVTLVLWANLLARLPTARLCVAGIAEGFALQRIANAFGENAVRVMFLPRTSVTEYRRAFENIDIALDPMPFSGATTTLDSLWQGVPVLTLPGGASCSRSSASLLTAVNLKDWIARDADDFVARAERFSGDVDALKALRLSLRQRVQESSMTNTQSFVRNLENALRDVWRKSCADRLAANGQPDRFAGTDQALMNAVALSNSQRHGDALSILQPLLHTRPQWDLAKREMARAALHWADQHPEMLPAWQQPFARVSRSLRVSAIVCSIRPEYFALIKQQLETQFARHTFELIGIHDAKSLCEAYNRGAARAKGEVLIFCHDDIDLVHADFGERLLTHLQTHDVIGVAGATKLVNAEWGTAGAPFVHGQIIHKPSGQQDFLYFGVGLQTAVAEGIHAMDGVFIAMQRRVWEAIRFDAETFDGFHVYDIDFTYRAHLAGYKLAVPLDLLLMHFSTGGYNLAWQTFNERFLKKFPEISGVPAMTRFSNLHVRLQTLDQIARLHVGLFAHNFGG